MSKQKDLLAEIEHQEAVIAEATDWDDWCCPHSECDEGRTYSDPDTVRSTCCDRGHEVRLTWHGGEVQARLHYRGRRLVVGPSGARSLGGEDMQIERVAATNGKRGH